MAIALVTGVSACARTVTGSAEAGASLKVPPPTASSQPTSEPPDSGSNGDAEQQAQTTCSQLPKDAVTSSFGVTGVHVTADSGTTLDGGILQIKCVIDADQNFRANVVVQIYPDSVLSDANQYLSIMQQKFPGVSTMDVPGADVSGSFQETVDSVLVDEAFVATKDSDNKTVDVLLAGIADGDGVKPKLTKFITALAND
ncbi:MAG TPA: hypothetical protein VFX16_24520 [Pseudonocardiaceae bacterium]|nr:hypothetical protein [Pseudonocardiaceae bacterium]